MTFNHSLKIYFFGRVNEERSARYPSLVLLSFLLPLDAVLDHGIVLHHFFVHGGFILSITERLVGFELGCQCFYEGNGWFNIVSSKFLSVEAVSDFIEVFIVGIDVRIT